MKIISQFLFFFLLTFIVCSCSAEEYEKEVFESRTRTQQKVQEDQDDLDEYQAETNDGYDAVDNDAEYDDTTREGGEVVPNVKINSLRIVSISQDDIRSGFRIEINNSLEDDDLYGFRVVWMHNGEELLGETESTLSWREEFKKGDKIKVVLIPELENIESPLVTESDFTVPNSPPRIVSEPPLEIKNGKFEYEVQAEDPDGDEIEFLLRKSPKGMTIEPASGMILWDFTKEEPGTEKVIEIVATDTEGLSYIQELTLTIPEQQPEPAEEETKVEVEESP